MAADPGVDKLVETLDGASNSLQSWSQGLDKIGKLADALPAVPTSPGSVLGFGDLVHQWFNNGTKKLADAVDDGDLNINQPIDLGGTDGRVGTLTSQLQTLGNGDKQLDVTVDVSKTVHDQSASVAVPVGGGSNAPQSAFSAQGGIDLSVHGNLAFRLVWDHLSNTVYFVNDGSTVPSLHVDASATIANAAAVKASIGILGVSLVNDSTLALDAHFAATVNDPNNDGRIAFENTDHSAGELAQAGSLAGLVSFGFASPAGSLNASLHLNAAPTSSFSLSLPAVDATIAVSWPNLATGSPTVTPTGINVAGKFLNMTPRDLADGVAQLATTLTSIQRAKFGTSSNPIGNLDLPFIKGSLADAIQLNETLKKFLKDNTIDAAVDAARAGQPTFVSIQELLDRLNGATGLPGGATIGISDVHYVDATSKLDFKITLHRAAPGSPVDLNAAGAASSGGAGSTYTATTLTDASQNWTPDEFAGHHVVAGASGATIASNTATTLTLQAPGWTPTIPTAGSPYTISGGQGNVGAVELGDSLKSSGKGVAEANAVNATAKVKPSYDASITLVLDLQQPTIHNPPIEQHNPDGSTVLVESTPTGPDRVLLRTTGSPALFTADLPIDASVDIFANAGFLQVELKGNAHVCKTSAGPTCVLTPDPNEHMVAISLKDNGDLTFGQVVAKLLTAPGDLLDVDVNVRAAGSVDVSVPGTTDFFGGASANATFSWNDLTALTGPNGPQFDVSDLSELVNFDFDPANPSALYSIILKTLQTLSGAIGDADPAGASIFSQQIPLVGRSLRDLLRADESGMGPQVTYGANTLTDASRSNAKGNAFASSLVGRSVIAGTQVGIVQAVGENTLTMSANWSSTPATGTAYILRSELDDAISILEASPSDNLQELIRTLDERLAGTPLSFEYKDMGGLIGPSVLIHVDWARSYHTSAPVKFDFSLPIGDQKLAGVQGDGSVSLGVDGHVKVGLVVPLHAGDGPPGPGDLQILDDSSIGVKLNASVDNATLATTVGPLTLSLGDPTSSDKATAKASYSVDLAKSGGTGAAQDFSSFIGAVAPAINATSDAVDCGFGGATDLALCARLPLYISDDGGTTYTKLITTAGASNEFALRLPKSTSPFSDYFNLAGAQIDGHNRIETPDATELGNAILSHIIDFTQINGIDGFLHLIEQGLNTASFGGKLPLIGKDLQQGADFVGKLRTSIHDAIGQLPGDGHFSDTSGVRDWVNDKLADALDSAGLNPDLVKVDTECTDTLAQATAPTVTPSPTGGGQTVKYAVAAYVKDSSDNVHESAVSAIGQTTDGPTTIDGSHTLALNWAPAVTGADGYHVYREVSGQLKFLADVTSGTTYTDNGSATPTADGPENPATNPRLHDCSYTNFDSVKIRIDVSQGHFTGGGDLDCAGAPAGHECISKSVPLDIGIPGLSLQSHNGAGPTVEIGWHLHLAFGISRSDGFFVDTLDEGTTPELALGLNFRIPGDLEAELAFINITAHNCTDSAGDQTLGCGADAPSAVAPLFGGSFSVDLKSPDPSGRLTVSDLSGASLDNLFDPKIKANVNIDWLLKAKVGEDAGFPGIQAEFRLDWALLNADLKSKASVGAPSISFVNVAIDTGEVFGHILSPIVNQIKKVTGPLDPIVKTLYAPVPVLSDLSHLVGGDDVTIISIAKAFSTIAGGPDLRFVDTILSVVNFINHFPTCTTSCLIPLGSFVLSGQKAVDNKVAPGNTESLIQSKSLSAQAAGGLLDDFNTKNSNAGAPNSFGGANSASAKAGFSFPVFENPGSLFNLILGGDVDLVKFDSGPLTLAFDWRQQFGPVYAPPPVVITLHGSASVTLHIVAGFDTYGIRKAFEKARAGELDLGGIGEAILQSLFFYTTDDNGKPLPVVSFTGEIAAGAAVTAVIITVGIEGGVGLTVSFLWNDPNHDGKFRISEFLEAALNNPICLFTVSGRLYVFLKLYITIGFSPFAVSFDFTIVDVTLLDFSATPDCDPPPPKLGGLSGDGKTLVIYAAALGHTAQRGHSSYESNNQDKETVKITSLHNYDVNPPAFTGVSVTMLGIKRDFTNASIERVVVDGRGYAKPMSVTFIGDAKADTSSTGPPPPTAQFDRDAIVFGGSEKDNIKTGIGDSWVDGGAGDDVIVTGDRTVLNADKTDYLKPNAKARVAGGAGADSITVGTGDDIVSGDSNLGNPPPTTSLSLTDLVNDDRDTGDPLVSGQGQPGASVTVPNWASLPNPADGTGSGDGRDTLKVGLGHSTIYGNGHNDTLGVGADDPLAKSRPAQAAMFTSPGATLVGGDGSDNFAGGTGPDTIYTACQTVTSIDGTGCTDNATAGDPAGSPVNVVDTGTGNDTVYGGTGQDRVTGHSLPPASPAQHDDIRGGSGPDILIGGFGTDAIYGGPDDDYVIAEPSDVAGVPALPNVAPDDGFGPAYTVTHLPLPQGVASQPKTLVGGLGRDHIIGGDGGASVYGDQQTSPCVAGAPVASDPVDESVNNVLDGNDLISGGAGIENVRAGGGNDNVDVKGNDDFACGEKGDDVLHGGSENDQAWGGSGQDTMYGETGADKLYGNDDNDAIYGGDGNDEIEGNNGTDWISGSNNADIVIGGTRATGRDDAGDFLSGDNDADVLIGDNGDFVSGVWIPLDLSGSPASAGGGDMIWGGANNDTCFGGLDNDTLFGGTGDDHCEGNNADDTIHGEAGEDELVGGSFQEASTGVGRPDGTDTINGGSEPDVITGDNAIVAIAAPAATTDTVKGRGFVNGHSIVLLDLGYTPAAANSAGDNLHGNDGTDVIYGQGGADTITGDAHDDYAEGGPAVDTINGNDGADDLVGGSSTLFAAGVGQPDTGDIIAGDAEADVIIGDNGKVIRDPAATPNPLTNRTGMATQRAIALYDLGPTPHANSSGDDLVTGDDGVDVVFGQGGDDRLKGNAGDDYVEGDQGSDAIEGDASDDDLVGGSSTPQSGSGTATVGQLDDSDAIYGGPGDDVETGDNALVLRVGSRTKTVDRLGSAGGTRMTSRNITLFDLNGPNFLTAPPANLSGDDRVSGGSGVDVAYGQDGNDQMTGGPHADYMEGNGDNDILRGDVRLDQAPTNPAEALTTLLGTAWPGSASGFADLEGAGADGQDDMVGGSSMPAFRDNADDLEGDGESDFQLGDNGVLRHDIQGTEPNASDRVFVQRYPDGPLPANAAVVRLGDVSVNPNGSTRFCTTAQATCEPAAASGIDTMYGDGGDDTMWGQDDNDVMHGNDQNDDMYGELGNDVMFGEDGQDAMLGDRGGVVDELMNPSDAGKQFTATLQNPPKETYVGMRQGTLDHRVDLLHDINGDVFLGSSSSPAMAHPGLNEGGNDRIRGGPGQDNIHAGFGDDLANGDSGGDVVFGDDGTDVMWGGQGCDNVANAASPDCLTNGTFDPSSRGDNDRFVDHVYGGVGGTSSSSKKDASGSDIMDWRPRGTFATCTPNPFPVTTKNVTVDPCVWFEMTNTDDDTANPATTVNNQHHQGTDWMYGGWDRDVMQADVSGNGPNPGDRLIDWNGAYNLYTACNSAYGGFNDVRQHSPAMQSFLQQLTFGDGAGQVSGDTAASGRSGYRELALAYPGETAHSAGPAYPSTPGHFDDPYSCSS